MPSPPAEVPIDADLIARLVDSRFPELSAPVRIVGEGWDNVVARLGEDLAVRIPRRAESVALIANEAACLPVIAERLPIPVPMPVRVGSPDHLFPWPWLIVRWTPGRSVDTILGVAPLAAVARTLADVHRRLHVPAPSDAPRNPVRGVPLADRADALARRVDELAPRLDLSHVAADALDAPPWESAPVWIHGDPHPGNILVTDDAEPRLAALIDFGDIAAGDPATDLAVAWLAFDPSERALYRDVLDPDDATWRRARGWAVLLAGALATSSDEHPTHRRIVEHALIQLRTD